MVNSEDKGKSDNVAGHGTLLVRLNYLLRSVAVASSGLQTFLVFPEFLFYPVLGSGNRFGGLGNYRTERGAPERFVPARTFSTI